MNDEEIAELIGLSLDEQLPEALRRTVDQYLAQHPDAAQDTATLRETVAKLRAAHTERPDPWFVERALKGLLRDNNSATGPGGYLAMGE
ncbi:MAG: hypothetical protein ABIY70_25655 [Capsulimonas sp.]|jgi:anti-sigma factor RsiW|uniref:anti-sigma factor family protein n=1 Tax=Capsulimonas sp. TaxID=2494211 RepID=UPI0032635326|nr:hypothetical protein [Capsulimonas sp.]